MAQLHATVDEIQLTKRMLTSVENVALASWTDEQYPSAKAVADKIMAITPGGGGSVEYPVGSIIITSTNTNPGVSIGGTWSLIDKEYKNEYKAIPHFLPAWTASRASVGGGITRANHEICIKFWLTTTAEVKSGNTLGSISRVLSGVKDNGSFSLSNEGGIAYAIGPNNESYIIRYVLNGGGDLSVDMVYDNKTLPVGTLIHIHTIVPMTNDDMLDDACDKFYWKRES